MKEISRIQLNVSGIDYTVKAEDVTAETSLNSYLREILHFSGTKRMCLEGGCGTCIVAVEVNTDGNKQVFAVNSCLVSILSCHGWKIHSVEGIGNPTKGYHQIQKLLVENNGTQCGFCSPGMVMNMFALMESGPKTKAEIENSFGGNICRCTGYRPILTAFYTLASDKIADIEEVASCTKECVKTCDKPCSKKESFSLTVGKSNWIKVYYLKDLLEVLRTSGNADYMLLAGNTAQGVLWPTRTSYPEIYIDITSVEELTKYASTETSLTLGGNVSLTKTMDIFNNVAKTYPNFSYLSEMAGHIDLVANVPVRNIGTLAGNLMLKHSERRFQSDIFLILEAVKATLVIIDGENSELRKSPQEFLAVDMEKKVLKEIIFRGYDPKKYYYQSYKIMNRAQNTHAVVNAGFLFKLSTEGIVKSANIVYGAITKNFVHAPMTETILKGQNLFDNSTLQKAFKSLSQEINPDINPPDPGPECRKQLAINLLYKFVLSIAPSSKLSPVNKSGATVLTRPVSSGVQSFSSNKSTYPLTEPIKKLEGLAQTSGQAQYIVDRPDLPNQLHGCFVTAETTPGCLIESIDTSKAFALSGVVAFYTAKDIPGVNSITVLSFGLTAEELFCSSEVKYFSQPVGIIVANKHETAVQAADLVKISYRKTASKPLLTPQDVLKAKKSDRIVHLSSVVPKFSGTATKSIKGDFYIGTQYHLHMETQCCDAVPTEDGLELWSGSQWIAHTQFAVSQILNLDAQKIDITVKRLGGAFGGKIIKSAYVTGAAALAAHKLQKPVKMWMRYHHNMKAIGKRMPLYAKYDVGVNEKGVIQHMDTELYSDCGIGFGNEASYPFLMDCFENAYKFDTWAFDMYIARTDTHNNTYARSPGTLEGLACIEAIMDDIAYTLNLDPLQVRMSNLNSKKYPKIAEFINEMKSKDKLDERIAKIRAFNQANRWKKKGISVVPMKWTLGLLGNYTTLVSIFFQNGGVAICHGGVEMGQGINTKVVQVCAYKLGISMDLISIKPTCSFVSPNSFATGGSWTSEAICLSVVEACDELLARMKPVKDAHPDAPWEQLVKLCYLANINLSSNGFVYRDGKKIQDYPIFGVCAAEVEVDILTGQKIISRVDIIEDVGESISPLVDIGQVEGAFVMGIGYHLFEELILSPEGEVLNNRTWNYTPPGVKDIPVDFRIRFPENNPNHAGVLNSKATAEPPICLAVSVPLAIRNALASARTDADSTKSKWVPFNGPTTVENILLNTLNDYTQYKL